MPKAWSKNEKELVRKALIEQGRRLFEKYGLQKTTVDEIVKAARISKGAFYFFYKSKEELYFEILGVVEHEFKEEVYRSLMAPGLSHRESFKQFLQKTVDFLTTVPIYRQIDSANLQYLMRKLPPEVLEKHMNSDREYFAQYLQTWINKGWMRKVSVEALNGLLLSLVYFVIHREDIGGSGFEASKDLLIDMISEYLIPEK
jgi:AcrR family transcriptional regulator